MGDNSTNVKIHDEQTGKSYTIDLTSIVGDVRNIMLSNRKHQTTLQTWDHMSEDDQQTEIAKMTNLAMDIVRDVVALISMRGVAEIMANLEDVSLKSGKAVLKIADMTDDDTLIALGHNIGKTVKIMMADISAFDQTRTHIAPTPDQKDLLDQSEDGDGDIENQIEDGDDIAKQVDGSEATDEPVQTSAAGDGYIAAGEGVNRDENPFEDGSNEHENWHIGWDNCNTDMRKISDEGYEACKAGQAPKDNPYPADSDSSELWRTGYLKREAEEKAGPIDEPPVDQSGEDQEASGDE